MEIDKEILEYVTEELYLKSIEGLKIGEYRKIYEDDKTVIRVSKSGKKTYTFISKFKGKKTLDEALNNIISLAI